MRLFNTAAKANPLILLLSLLAGAIALFIAFKDGVKEATEAQIAFNEELEKTKELSDQSIKDQIAAIDEQLAAIDQTTVGTENATKKKIDLLSDEIDKRKEVTDVLKETSAAQKKSIGDIVAEAQGLKKVSVGFKEIGEIAKQTSKELDALEQSEIIDALRKRRLALIRSLGLRGGERNVKAAEKRAKLLQKIAELEIQNDINTQKRIIDNQDNSNDRIVKAIKERVRLEVELERLKADFVINSTNSTAEEIVIAQKKLQDKLTDIVINGVKDRKKATQRVELDDEIDDPLEGFDTAQFLINALVKAGQGTFAELQMLYDKDLDAFLKLAEAKLNITKQFSQAQFDAIANVFQGFDSLYNIDGSKFLNLFTNKKLTTQDFVDASAEASKALVEAFSKDYTADLNNLRIKEDLALELAGDNTAAQEEIRRQFAEKEAELRNKQAKADKDTAIFRIIIDTARGVIAALTSTPPNIPLSIAVGAIGAASLAKVLTTEIPQFKEGVRGFTGGKAVLGDGGVTEFAVLPNKEVIKTPSHATLYDLPRGTDVYRNEDEFTKELLRELNFNGILPSVHRFGRTQSGSSGLTKEDFNTGIKSLQSTIKNNEYNQLIFDESGYTKYRIKSDARVKLLNNRFVMKGKKV